LTGVGSASLPLGGPSVAFAADETAYGSADETAYGLWVFWNAGKEGTPGRPNLAYKPRYKQGYFPVPPMDKFQDIRSDMVLALESTGVRVEVHHHEVATAGQTEVDMRYNTLTKMADAVLWYKYCAKNTARRHGKTACFMPKPLFQDNGSGMHTHQSLWKRGKNIFYDKGSYADVSRTCLYYIGGILKHAPALCALIAPTTNSYRRLVPGYEAPINLVYSQRNRSACIRIPMYSRSEKAKRIEFRTPDPSCNPYLSFAACLMAGLDGIAHKIDPGKPVDKDLYELPESEAKRIQQLPGSLDVVLDALEKDHQFLLKGEVFTPDLIETWIDYKRKNEVDAIRLRPHPWEFVLYSDI
jgi:glutamine synthetase